MFRNIAEWLERKYNKAQRRNLKRTNRTPYQYIPEEARIANALSNQAMFLSCAFRRRGYVVQVETSALVKLAGEAKLSEEREEILHDAWLRGVFWTPLVCKAAVEDGRWVLHKVKDMDVALFLEGRQHTVSLQIIEPGDPPGTKANLRLLEAGLFTKNGGHCPVLYARITY